MKILFVSDTYYPHLNGVYYFVCRIGPLLQKKGHQVVVIAPSETVNPSLKKIDGLDVYGVPSLPVVYYPKVRIPIPMGLKHRIRIIIDTFKPDIIHLQDHFSISKAVIEANKQRNIPIMGTNHFMTENLTSFVKSKKWKMRLESFMWRDFSKVFNNLDIITTPTETAANLIRPKLKKDVIAISNGIEFKKFNAETINKCDLFVDYAFSIKERKINLKLLPKNTEKFLTAELSL